MLACTVACTVRPRPLRPSASDYDDSLYCVRRLRDMWQSEMSDRHCALHIHIEFLLPFAWIAIQHWIAVQHTSITDQHRYISKGSENVLDSGAHFATIAYINNTWK